jgi:hypothetical protein
MGRSPHLLRLSSVLARSAEFRFCSFEIVGLEAGAPDRNPTAHRGGSDRLSLIAVGKENSVRRGGCSGRRNRRTRPWTAAERRGIMNDRRPSSDRSIHPAISRDRHLSRWWRGILSSADEGTGCDGGSSAESVGRLPPVADPAYGTGRSPSIDTTETRTPFWGHWVAGSNPVIPTTFFIRIVFEHSGVATGAEGDSVQGLGERLICRGLTASQSRR